MQVCETFLNKKWQTVMWHRECEQRIHIQQPRGLGRGGKDFSLKAKAWGTKAKAKTLSSKAKTLTRCPRGQGRYLLREKPCLRCTGMTVSRC